MVVVSVYVLKVRLVLMGKIKKIEIFLIWMGMGKITNCD